eukprot:TRINITY_DN15820_c0_g2_i1.p1 TRINITY_DN15820_c0_g2~~TRINITY_DN15820_c0_g2_i1.p1  ORF type:complete len:370 (-),score=40.09 TRINITY_DN15820_c0_g2_i1:17-1126(-)
MTRIVSMFIGLGGIFASGALLLAMLLVFNTGGAFFGERALGRWAARFSTCVMLVLLGMEWYVFSVVCRPENPVWRVLGAFMLVLILWSFFRTAFTNPGTSASDEWQAWEALNLCADDRGSAFKIVNGMDGNDAQKALLENTMKLTVTLSGQPSPVMKAADPQPCVDAKNTRRRWPKPGVPTHCDICQRSRPERAHHCRVCGVCVQRVDHHCPMVGNCIGEGNLKCFFVLNWWQVWGCLLFLLCPDGPCSKIFKKGCAFDAASIRMMVFASIVWSIVVLCISLHAAVKVLVLATKNETTIESLFFTDANPYKLQSRIDNLRHVLGPLDVRLFLPIRPPVSKPPLNRTADSLASSATGNHGIPANKADRAV